MKTQVIKKTHLRKGNQSFYVIILLHESGVYQVNYTHADRGLNKVIESHTEQTTNLTLANEIFASAKEEYIREFGAKIYRTTER